MMTRKRFIFSAKRFRNGLFMLTGIGFLSMIFMRLFPSVISPVAGIIILATLIVPFFISVVLQVVIVLLVGKPPSPPKDNPGITHTANPENLPDVNINDWLGANAYLRLGMMSLFLFFLILLMKDQHSGIDWGFLAVVAIICMWLICFPISRITFDRVGIQLESTSFHTWGFGRHVSVPYHELSVRQSKMSFGDSATLYRSGRRICFVTRNRWLSYKYSQVLHELSQRLPESQCSFLWVYKN